jgi:2-polyprenyl-6-methoxyphenol hydroxylase-like FAD-dependent oxidoreductase
MTDVLIAGGGIAGSALAIMLGRQGLSVELYERGNFPKEKPCGEGLMPGGIAVLQRLRLAQQVGGTPFFGVRYHVGKQVAQGRFPKVDGYPAFGRGQRRRILDETLFGAAAETPGVSAHTGTQVTSLLWENERVAGAVVDGEPRRAALVVAADGVHSRLRHLAGLEMPAGRKRFGVCTHFRLAAGQEQLPWVEIFLGQGYELYVTPLPKHEILVAGLADAQSLKEYQGAGAATSIEKIFRGWWQAQPALARRLEGAEQVSALLTTSPLAGRARAGVAPGMVLLGDAAGFVDPITGGGMTQALMTTELLAQTIVRGLEENKDWLADDSWLATYDRGRRAILRDYQIVTRMVLWLADHPRLAARTLSALGSCPKIFSHLIGVTSGTRGLCGGTVRAPARIPAMAFARRASARKNGAAGWIPEISGPGAPPDRADNAGG